jgi:energy-coupling factor transporter transmembrane protein EcfT
MEHHSEPQKLPSWLMLLIFLIIMAVLFFLGDTFTFILGLLVMAIIFAGGYDRNPANHEHH